MSAKTVIVLAGHSLLAEGTANWLRQYADRVRVQIIDPVINDVVDQTVSAKPAVIIMDTCDPDLVHSNCLCHILRALPKVKVLLLDSLHSQIQIVSTSLHPTAEMQDLIELIVSPA
jgi:DNA-binding NarL/FixJ family response regulator